MAVLRRAGPADAVAVRDVTHAAYAKWVPVLGREPLTMQVDYAEAVQRHRIDLLAHAEQIARAERHAAIRLYANALLVENVAFYACNGFAVEREEAFLGGTLIHMLKQGAGA